MPLTRQVERHVTSGVTVRDIVIGMSDGLTVPFALAAGLSGAIESTSIVITASLAEIAAGSIAMGLGGYLAARSDAEHSTPCRTGLSPTCSLGTLASKRTSSINCSTLARSGWRGRCCCWRGTVSQTRHIGYSRASLRKRSRK